MTGLRDDCERVARALHDVHEELAPGFQYSNRPPPFMKWEDTPQELRQLLIATIQRLVEDGVIHIYAMPGAYVPPAKRVDNPHVLSGDKPAPIGPSGY